MKDRSNRIMPKREQNKPTVSEKPTPRAQRRVSSRNPHSVMDLVASKEVARSLENRPSGRRSVIS
jgi:hypothetical protein